MTKITWDQLSLVKKQNKKQNGQRMHWLVRMGKINISHKYIDRYIGEYDLQISIYKNNAG